MIHRLLRHHIVYIACYRFQNTFRALSDLITSKPVKAGWGTSLYRLGGSERRKICPRSLNQKLEASRLELLSPKPVLFLYNNTVSSTNNTLSSWKEGRLGSSKQLNCLQKLQVNLPHILLFCPVLVMEDLNLCPDGSDQLSSKMEVPTWQTSSQLWPQI